jgi:hypothetical protein
MVENRWKDMETRSSRLAKRQHCNNVTATDVRA